MRKLLYFQSIGQFTNKTYAPAMQHKVYSKVRVLDVRNSMLDITRECGEPTIIK
jgi:hypothetical protein